MVRQAEVPEEVVHMVLDVVPDTVRGVQIQLDETPDASRCRVLEVEVLPGEEAEEIATPPRRPVREVRTPFHHRSVLQEEEHHPVGILR